MNIKKLNKLFILFATFFVFNDSFSQEISITGSVICKEKRTQNLVEKTFAPNIIVMPFKRLDLATISERDGSFKIKFRRKDLVFEATNADFLLICRDTSEIIGGYRKRFWESDIKGKSKINLKDLVVSKSCDKVNFNEVEIKEYLDELRAAAIDTQRYSFWQRPAVLSILAAGIGGAGIFVFAPGRPDSTVMDTLTIADINPATARTGVFLSNSFSALSRNIGFNFLPIRNMEDAVFWNSSVLHRAYSSQIHFYSDFQRFYRGSISIPIKNNFGFGIGGLLLKQSEVRNAFLENNEFYSEKVGNDEWAIYFSGSVRLGNKISFGITSKYISQIFRSPLQVKRTTIIRGGQPESPKNSFIIQKTDTSFFDFDISSTFELAPSFKIGVSLMNLANTKLLTNEGTNETRALGIGLLYLNKRIHFGTDWKIDGSKVDVSVGVNYIPFNRGKINVGISNAFNTFVTGFKQQLPQPVGFVNLGYTYNRNDFLGSTHFIELSLKLH